MDHRSPSEKLEEYAALLLEKRRHKGMTLDRARDLLMDANYYGERHTLLVSANMANAEARVSSLPDQA